MMEERKIQAIRTFTNDRINQTTQSLNVSPEVAFLLLDHFQWNQEELNKQWESSKDELIKTLHISLGSTAAETLESNLLAKECGLGTCSACHRERRLVELYCGHKICNDCLANQIKSALDKNEIPRCQQDCNAEILGNTVEKMVPHNNSSRIYKYLRTNISFEKSHIKVVICPNPLCRHLIALSEENSSDLVRCPNCEFAICLNCMTESHAPLCNCERVADFTETIPKRFNKLLEEEQNWYKREKSCLECRLENQNEVKHALNIEHKILVREQQSEQQEILQQIKNTDLFVQAVSYEISQLDDKILEFQAKKRSPERIEELKKQIGILNDDIDHYKEFKDQLIKENEVRKVQRKKDLDFAEKQRKLFLHAIQSRDNYESYIQKYREGLEQFAQEKATLIMDEEDYIRQNTVICPQCGLRFYKDSGCYEVTCPCGHEFCTLCRESWITHGQGFYRCPNIAPQKEFNYNDNSDVRFFTNPMTLEKKISYYKWKHFHDLFLTHKAKYNELFQRFLLGKDKVPQKGEKLTDDDLCPYTKLVNKFEQENREEGRTNALKLISNLLFAQSIVSWGHAALYYINITEFTQEYKEKLQSLEKKEDDLAELLNDPAAHEAQIFQEKLGDLKDEINIVLSYKL